MGIQVQPSGDTNLLDYTFNPDTTLTGPDGSILYPGEIQAANAADGTLDTLIQVMSGAGTQEGMDTGSLQAE